MTRTSTNLVAAGLIGRHRAVPDALMAGLEQRAASDADLAGTDSLASFLDAAAMLPARHANPPLGR